MADLSKQYIPDLGTFLNSQMNMGPLDVENSYFEKSLMYSLEVTGE